MLQAHVKQPANDSTEPLRQAVKIMDRVDRPEWVAQKFEEFNEPSVGVQNGSDEEMELGEEIGALTVGALHILAGATWVAIEVLPDFGREAPGHKSR